MSDPCDRCPLPDCDTASRRCVVRRLSASYNAKLDRGAHDEVTPQERAASNEVFRWWQLERLALASEGVKPYARANSPWKPGEPFKGQNHEHRQE